METNEKPNQEIPANADPTSTLNALMAKSQRVQDLLEADLGGLSGLEAKVLRSVKRKELLSHNVERDMDANMSLGDRLADWITGWVGTMAFVYWNGAAFLGWIVLNSNLIPGVSAFDPYPYGMLTMIVSLEAIFLSLFVLISQNRTAEKDRIRGEYDYKTDLKAEIEIRHLSQKVDLFIEKTWQRHLEVQQLQLDLLKEVAAKSGIVLAMPKDSQTGSGDVQTPGA